MDALLLVAFDAGLGVFGWWLRCVVCFCLVWIVFGWIVFWFGVGLFACVVGFAVYRGFEVIAFVVCLLIAFG